LGGLLKGAKNILPTIVGWLMCYNEGELKKAKLIAAMAGNEVAQNNQGRLESKSGNIEQSVKNWTIAVSAGCYESMHVLITWFEQGLAYNNSFAQMRSKARDAYICSLTE
jgi:hypothetical protein